MVTYLRVGSIHSRKFFFRNLKSSFVPELRARLLYRHEEQRYRPRGITAFVILRVDDLMS